MWHNALTAQSSELKHFVILFSSKKHQRIVQLSILCTYRVHYMRTYRSTFLVYSYISSQWMWILVRLNMARIMLHREKQILAKTSFDCLVATLQPNTWGPLQTFTRGIAWQTSMLMSCMTYCCAIVYFKGHDCYVLFCLVFSLYVRSEHGL